MSDLPVSENPKPALRKQARLLRQTLPIAELSTAIQAQLANWPVFANAKQVLAFFPHAGEVDLIPLTGLFPDKHWFLPRVSAADGMQFHRYQPGDALTPGSYGIPEPHTSADLLAGLSPTDLIILPGLMFDRDGYRLGYGKGYYDRFLAHEITGIRLGPVPEALLCEALPREAWDLPAHFLVTESRLLTI